MKKEKEADFKREEERRKDYTRGGGRLLAKQREKRGLVHQVQK